MSARVSRALACCRRSRPWFNAAPAFLALAFVAGAAAQTAPGRIVTTLTLFAGNDEGLWRSRDWGGRWELVRAPALESLGAVRVIQPFGLRVYLGGAGGLYVSEDFGETWARRGGLADVRALVSSRYHEADPTLFAGTGRGLFKSPDDGLSFRPTLLQGAAVTRLQWPGPALVVATERGIRLSDDGASNWRALPRGLPEGAIHSVATSSYFLVDPVLFAGVGSDGVWRSGDGGATWQPAGLAGRRVNDLVWLGPILYLATDAGLYRGEDAGTRFTRIGEGLGEAAVTSLLFPLAPDSGAEFFAATERGVFRTLDGGLRFEPTGFKGPVSVLATFPPPEPARRKR